MQTNLQRMLKTIQHGISLIRLAILCLVLMTACSETKETRLQRFLAQGNEMVSRKNYEQAIDYYQGALRLDSCFADALNNLGTVYYNTKDYSNALIHYTRAIECRPQYIEAYINRANTYYETNELFSALRDLDRVASKNPDTLVLHFLRGLIFTKLRHYPEAENSFKKALMIDPDNVELKVNLGTVYFYERKNDSARALLQSVIAGNKEPNAYNTLSLLETVNGNYSQAMEWIAKALAIRPDDPYYLNNRGYIYLMLKEYEKALEDINQSITSDPYNGWAYRNKGIYYLKQSSPADAIRMFRQAEGLDKHIEDIYYYLGEGYWAAGDEAQACVFYRKSLEMKESSKPERGRCQSR
jgi:tetratricopeptide (TPR) repeat protein